MKKPRKIIVKWNARKQMWVRFCPACPERYQVDYWLTWNGAMRNANRHALLHHHYERRHEYGARLKVGA